MSDTALWKSVCSFKMNAARALAGNKSVGDKVPLDPILHPLGWCFPISVLILRRDLVCIFPYLFCTVRVTTAASEHSRLNLCIAVQIHCCSSAHVVEVVSQCARCMPTFHVYIQDNELTWAWLCPKHCK